jgi:hypothetical protein
MKKVLPCLLVLLLMLGCTANGLPAIDPAEPTSDMNATTDQSAATKEVDLILFTGQSNMLGRDTELYETEIPEGKAFWYSYAEETLFPVQNPVGENCLGFSKSSGSSMIPEFCARYIEQTGRSVVCVLLANGGVSIQHFAPDGTAISGMQLYLNNCQNWLEKNGYSVQHRFYVMLHGETDSTDPVNEHYGEDLLAFHNVLKEFFDFEFGALVLNGGTAEKDETGVKVINDTKITLAKEETDIIVASTTIPLHFFDDPSWVYGDTLNIHLTKDAIRLVGAEAADSIVRFMTDGIDPVEYLPLP